MQPPLPTIRLLPDDEHDRQLVANVHPAGWVNPKSVGRYNLVVIGAGTAGLVSAIGAAGLGAMVMWEPGQGLNGAVRAGVDQLAAAGVERVIVAHGDLPRARGVWTKLAPLMRLQFSAYLGRGDGAHWFSVMKATLNLIGPPVGDPAPPVLPLEPEWRAQLIPMLRDLGYTVRAEC